MKKTRIGLVVEPALKQALERAAHVYGVSLSTVVRWILEGKVQPPVPKAARGK